MVQSSIGATLFYFCGQGTKSFALKTRLVARFEIKEINKLDIKYFG